MKYEFKEIKDVDLSKLEDGKYFLKLDTITGYSCHELRAIKFCKANITHILLPCSPIDTDKLNNAIDNLATTLHSIISPKVGVDKLKREFLTHMESKPIATLFSGEFEGIFDFFLPHLSVSKEVEVSDEEIEKEAMINAFYKIAETIDFNIPEYKDLFDLIYPFLHPASIGLKDKQGIAPKEVEEKK